jgi:hypothetical protein
MIETDATDNVESRFFVVLGKAMGIDELWIDSIDRQFESRLIAYVALFCFAGAWRSAS